MKSLGKVCEEIINRSPFLRESISEDLVNISALARKIKPEIDSQLGEEVKEGAIIMAIKRLTPGLYQKLNIKIKKCSRRLRRLFSKKWFGRFHLL